ncbi:MAG: VWA domain-containing protein [Spirochaetia bacterium]|nr:VWA domain-containing protein [Spirochaetia bacterium]
MITFDFPGMLLFIAILPPLIFLRHFWKNRGGRLSFSFTIWQKEVFKPGIYLSNLILFLSSFLFWIGFLLLLIANAGPSLVSRERIYLTRGIDIIFVLDESPSMAGKDFLPDNRFESAKDVIKTFVKGRDHDPVGLVSFGKNAVLRVPPGLDYEYFLEHLEGLQLMDLGNGTAMGMGIAVACLHLDKSTAKEKVIILLTDGDNNAGEILPESAANIAAAMGIKIYSVGIGSSGEVPLEFTDPETGKIYRGMFESGYNEEILKEISEITRGEFFQALSPGALNTIMSSIDSLERIEKRTRLDINTTSIHRELILIGFILILVDFFLKKWIFREVL